MKILNYGSLNLDYVYSVPHFVQPGETISSRKREIFCGGKGLNQSVAAARAGANVFHAGKIGASGRPLAELLRSAGVNTDFLRSDPGVETGHTVIQIDPSGQNSIILYGGANQAISSAEVDDTLARFERGDILLLQNEINATGELLEKAGKRGLRVALNPSPITPELERFPLQNVSWFLLNEIEGHALTGKNAPEEIADELLRRYPHSSVVLTLGKDGVYYRDEQTRARHGIYRVKPVDTTGAGDTFTGYFLAGIAQGLDIHENLRRASVAASIAVSRAGAAPSIPLLREVLSSNLQPIES